MRKTDKQGFPWTNAPVPRRIPHNLPRITIVTPSYNQGEFIEETIRSILLQGYPNLEYIVIDGGSTDNTLEVLRRYAHLLDYTMTEPDNGQAHAINKGFQRSTGDIMGWVNSDDILLPNALFRIAEAFQNESITVVTGFREVRNRNSEFVRYWIRDIPSVHYLTKYCCVAQETTFWRRSVWEELGALDESMHFALDYEYWLRMLQAGHQFKLLPHYIGAFRDYDENKSSTLYETYRQDMHRIYQRFNLAISEQDMLGQLGPDWVAKYNVITEMCQTPILRYPRLTILLLWVMELSLVERLVARVYRFTKQTEQGTYSDASIVLQPVTRLPNWRVLGLDAEAMANVSLLNQRDDLPLDGILFGQGWYGFETDAQGATVCWASRQTQLIVTLPTERTLQLRLRLMIGPSINGKRFMLRAYDSEGKCMDEYPVTGLDTVRLNLKLRPGRSQSVFLCVEEADFVPFAGDARELCFQLREIGWSHQLYDTPQNIAAYTQPHDIMKLLPTTNELPQNGLYIGDGWYSVEQGDGKVFRWAYNNAEIIVTRPQNVPLCIELEAGNYDMPTELSVIDQSGNIVLLTTLNHHQILHIPVSKTDDPFQVYRLHVADNARPIAGDVRQLNFRVLQVDWLPLDASHNSALQHFQNITSMSSRRIAQTPFIGQWLVKLLWLRNLGHQWAAESVVLEQLTRQVEELDKLFERQDS
jgi:glycosyltransferase involved in cell wall biosynthesis